MTPIQFIEKIFGKIAKFFSSNQPTEPAKAGGFLTLAVSKIIENITDDSVKRVMGQETGTVLFDVIFTNGISFRPKEGRVLIVKKGNAVDDFFLNMHGYCFIHELLPHDFIWESESEKWWIIPNPTNKEKVKEILKFLNTFGRAKNLVARIKKLAGYETILSENNPAKKISSWKKDVHNSTGVAIFQNWTAQKKVGFRKVNIATYENGQLITVPEDSPYYFASKFPYTFVVQDQEDSNNIPTTMTITVMARNINPYISEVETGKVFDALGNTVTGTAAEIIRLNPCHETSQQVSINAGTTPKPPGEILQEISDAIKDELHKPEKFFGFNILDVSILQVEITGDQAVKLKEAASNVFIAKTTNNAANITNEGENSRRILTAESKKQSQIIEADGKAAEIFKLLKAEARGQKELGNMNAEALETLITKIRTAGGDVKLAQMERIIKQYHPGGFQVNNDNILNLINQNTTVV